MIIFSGKKILPVIVVLCFFSLIFGNASLNITKTAKMSPRKKTLIALLFTTNASFFSPDLERKGLCRWLKGLKHQRKLCQSKKGLPALLQETRKWTLDACKEQFEYDHWNCSTTNMRRFFKKMYRETAFMYSLATSAFMYIVSKACAEGKLANCKCAESPVKTDNMTDWQWGGCGYNTKYAKKFTKTFLQLRKKGDNLGNIMNYNSEVGIKVVQKREEKYCKCHGLSGSCTFHICWKRLKPFHEIAHDLKQLYHRATQIVPNNNLHELEVHKKKKNMVFLDTSPNYCDPLGGKDVTTVGRRCKDIDNCATLCCSRGYDVSTHTVFEKCHCRWRNETPLKLKCESCSREEIHLYCK